MFRAIIVEDEAASRDRLRRLLEQHHGDEVEIVDEADSGPAAVAVINERRPDLVFLDVSLPGFDGFDVLRRITLAVKVVFTTAYSEYAVQAFRERALHYLVKPIDPEQLSEALDRVRASSKKAAGEPARSSLNRILCRDRDTTYVIRPSDVLFLKADQGYTLVRTHNKEYLTADALAFLEEALGDDFVRIHRNAVVNVTHVASLKHTGGEVTIVLQNGLELPVSRRHVPGLREKLLYGTD